MERHTFTDLLDRPDVVETVELGSTFGLMAFHGGLEGGTAEIATMVAERTGASLYLVVQPPELRWHVPSALVTPAASSALAAFLAHVDVALALHGYGRFSRPIDVLVGGRNRALAAHVATCLRAAMAGFEVLDDLDGIPVEMRGIHRDNPVNRARGGGVQLELPHRARGTSARPGDAGRTTTPAAGLLDGLVEAIERWPDHSMSKLPPARQ